MCDALAIRFQANKANEIEELEKWDDDYADAMRLVYRDFSDDYDVCALTAEALVVRNFGPNVSEKLTTKLHGFNDPPF